MIDHVRAGALVALWNVIERATAPDAMTRLSVVTWIGERSEAHDGFLWLTGRLGLQPNVASFALLSVTVASPRRRLSVRRRMFQLLCEAPHVE